MSSGSTVVNETDWSSKQKVRIVRRELENGRPGVAITLTIDADELTDLAMLATAMSQCTMANNKRSYYRTVLADALNLAGRYVGSPGILNLYYGVLFTTTDGRKWDSVLVEQRTV